MDCCLLMTMPLVLPRRWISWYVPSSATSALYQGNLSTSWDKLSTIPLRRAHPLARTVWRCVTKKVLPSVQDATVCWTSPARPFCSVWRISTRPRRHIRRSSEASQSRSRTTPPEVTTSPCPPLSIRFRQASHRPS